MISKNIIHWFLSLTILLQTMTTVVAQEISASSGTQNKEHVHSENGTTRWRNSTGTTDFNIEMRGKIEVTDDDKDIKSVSNDGYLEITKTVFGSKRTIKVESLGNGKIKKEYYENRKLMDWEPQGRQWLGEILPEIVHITTLSAESRVDRMFNQGGTSRVLDEIGKIESDYVAAHYAKLLLNKNIPANEMATVITKISSSINSDYYLSSVLQQNIDKMLATSASAEAFLSGTEKINSDYYRSVVLKEALKKKAASPSQVKLILKSAAGINSDYYLSVVLTSLLEQQEMKEESLNDLVQISQKISSDYYRTQVISKAIEKNDLSKATLKRMVSTLADVNSDYYKTAVFNRLVENNVLEPEVQSEVAVILANSVNSDYYASVTLKKLLYHQKLNDESFKQLVTAAAGINSANYLADVLKEAATKNLSADQLANALRTAENINSDHYLSEVLLRYAPKVKANDNAGLTALYRQVAKKINSDTYYGRAIKAID